MNNKIKNKRTRRKRELQAKERVQFSLEQKRIDENIAKASLLGYDMSVKAINYEDSPIIGVDWGREESYSVPVTTLRGKAYPGWIDDASFMADKEIQKAMEILQNQGVAFHASTDKYVREEIIVHAVQYNLSKGRGLEDGFTLEDYMSEKVNLYNKAFSSFGHITKVPELFTDENLKRLVFPYIIDKDKKTVYIEKDDYIVIDNEGNKGLINKEDFEKNFRRARLYEEVKERL